MPQIKPTRKFKLNLSFDLDTQLAKEPENLRKLLETSGNSITSDRPKVALRAIKEIESISPRSCFVEAMTAIYKSDLSRDSENSLAATSTMVAKLKRYYDSLHPRDQEKVMAREAFSLALCTLAAMYSDDYPQHAKLMLERAIGVISGPPAREFIRGFVFLQAACNSEHLQEARETRIELLSQAWPRLAMEAPRSYPEPILKCGALFSSCMIAIGNFDDAREIAIQSRAAFERRTKSHSAESVESMLQVLENLFCSQFATNDILGGILTVRDAFCFLQDDSKPERIGRISAYVVFGDYFLSRPQNLDSDLLMLEHLANDKPLDRVVDGLNSGFKELELLLETNNISKETSGRLNNAITTAKQRLLG